MIQLLIKRIGALFFSLTVIIIIGFWLTKSMPGDPVQRMLGRANQSELGHSNFSSQKYDELYYQLGYQLPDFYLTWSNPYIPDSFYRAPQQNRRNQLIALSASCGNPLNVYSFRKVEEQLMYEIENSKTISSNDKIVLRLFAYKIQNLLSAEEISIFINKTKCFNNLKDENICLTYQKVIEQFQVFSHHKSSWKKWIPVISFHKQNRFHSWLLGDKFSENPEARELNKGVINGDLGYSTVSHRPVYIILKKAFTITFILSAISILVSVLLAIPTAVFLTLYRHKKIVKLAPGVLLFIYTIPSFFIGTLLLMLFANPSVFNFFPSSGVAPAEGFNPIFSVFQKFIYAVPYYVLPVITYVVGSFAFFIKLTQSLLEDQLGKDYIRTARAKGVSDKRIIGFHSLRNCLIPIITTSTTAFPVMISGSIVLENIFSIQGMGTEMIRSLQNQDYPVLIGFFLLMGVVSIIIFFLSDLLNSFVDPRIRIEKKEGLNV